MEPSSLQTEISSSWAVVVVVVDTFERAMDRRRYILVGSWSTGGGQQDKRMLWSTESQHQVRAENKNVMSTTEAKKTVAETVSAQ